MNILITGANGFLGKNLSERLRTLPDITVFLYDINSSMDELNKYLSTCDFLFHFAAVHRPAHSSEFVKVNHLLLKDILDKLTGFGNNCPVLLTSSIHAVSNTDYGKSKLEAENELKTNALKTGRHAIIYRLTNVFGKWAAPNSHSVVATFCYNIARGLPIVIHDPETILKLYYIDDVVSDFIAQLFDKPMTCSDGFFRLSEGLTYSVSLGRLAELLYSYQAGVLPGDNMFERRLHTTFQSYLPMGCETA